jgi:hypothetical protein
MKVGNEWRVAAKAAVIVLGGWFAIQVGVAAVWNTGGTTSFEEKPQNTAFVSGGAEKIRETRNEVRRRADVEHDWSTANVGDTDSGRHRKGSARAFFQATAPTAMPYADTGGSTTLLDEGRLWIDSDDGTLWANEAPTSAAWGRVSALPEFAIILWDQPTGCAGVDNVCPCGFTEAIEFRALGIRGADRLAATSAVPDLPGKTCDAGAPLYDAGCGATTQASAYSDTQTLSTLEGHSHTFGVGSAQSAGGSPLTVLISAGALSDASAPVSAWPGPLRTVLFCRKT